MNPALSVVFFTTLAGAGQGLLLALVGADAASRYRWMSASIEPRFVALGAALAALLATAGLAASFLHLGRPERAWRAAAMWRSSWLSREVIALPLFMGSLAAWGGAHLMGLAGTRWLGALAAVLCLALFACTAMVYASIRFLQEWASPLTLLNYLLLGCASGATLASALVAARLTPSEAAPFAAAALALTIAGLASRVASLRRNAGLKPRSTLQSATGIKHPVIVQRSQGFMGGSFNTREFFHGKAASVVKTVKWGFLVLAFPVPAALLAAGIAAGAPALTIAAFLVQYAGLIAERWFFFAQANHPQNLYYQRIS
jgi:DMSO reductase anchor subunit